MGTLEKWYKPEGSPVRAHTSASADLFDKAIEYFGWSLTSDGRKRSLAKDSCSIESLRAEVENAIKSYQDSRAFPKTRKWLTKVADRLHYYGAIGDVFAQVHPEYTALVWGAMRFIIIVSKPDDQTKQNGEIDRWTSQSFVNHGNVLYTLAKALAQIGQILPRIHLSLDLFPTERVKEAVIELYAYLLKFFIRARDWAQEGTIQHVIHSITRPVELRYKDLLGKIAECSRNIQDLAFWCALAEQRDMHTEMRDMVAFLNTSSAVGLDTRERVISLQAITSSGFINTNEQLTDLQFSQVLSFLSESCDVQPDKSLQHCVFMRNRRAHHPLLMGCEPVKFFPRINTWFNAPESAISVLQGMYSLRGDVVDFCTNLIQDFRNKTTLVLWVVKSFGVERARTSAIDILKSLVMQALRLAGRLPTESRMSLNCARVQRASTENDWMNILASILAQIQDTVYIVVDVEVADQHLETLEPAFTWVSGFLEMFKGLHERASFARVKVLLVSYGSNVLLGELRTGAPQASFTCASRPIFARNRVSKTRKARTKKVVWKAHR